MRDQASVHPEIERPPDLPPAPAGAGQGSGRRRAARFAHGRRGHLPDAEGRNRRARERDGRGGDSDRCRGAARRRGRQQRAWCCRGICRLIIESPIFARTNGYLLRWYKDIGSKVEKGELLASIDTPEVDQELSQARAAREQIKAALGLAKISADRWANLRKSDSVSQQEADQQDERLHAGAGEPGRGRRECAPAGRAGVVQECLRSFFRRAHAAQRRSRGADQFGSAGDWAGSCSISRASIHCACTCRFRRPMRPSMKVGMKAAVTLQEFPGQKFTGTVVRTADAIDMATRTLNTEVDVPNKDGKLLPGSFGQVHFAVGQSGPAESRFR